MQYWVSIISPLNVVCNVFMISCLSQVTTLMSSPNVFLNFENLFDDFLQHLIFLSTKSFRANTLHRWYLALDVNSCLYFCFFGSHLSKICAQLATSDFTYNSFLFTKKYLPLSITSILQFSYSSLLIWSILYMDKKKIIFFLMLNFVNFIIVTILSIIIVII